MFWEMPPHNESVPSFPFSVSFAEQGLGAAQPTCEFLVFLQSTASQQDGVLRRQTKVAAHLGCGSGFQSVNAQASPGECNNAFTS